MKDFNDQKENLISHYKQNGYVKDDLAFDAFRNVPRELFLPEALFDQAYNDHPLPLMDTKQTISAPHMCCMILDYLKLQKGQKILEIGSGSGYQAALIAHAIRDITKNEGHVYTIEIVPNLISFARQNIQSANLHDFITVIEGDGTLGYPEKEPYDRIILTAAGPTIPPPLMKQLKIGGYLVMPLGRPMTTQTMIRVEKTSEKDYETENLSFVGFVPLRGKYGI